MAVDGIVRARLRAVAQLDRIAAQLSGDALRFCFQDKEDKKQIAYPSNGCDGVSPSYCHRRAGERGIMDVNSNGLPAENGKTNGTQWRLLDHEFVTNASGRSAENPADRRRFMRRAGLAALAWRPRGPWSAPARA